MTNLTIATNSIYATGGPFAVLSGSVVIVNFNFLGSGTISSATNKLYRNKADVTADKLSSSNASVSGRVITTALITLNVPGDYQLEVTAVDGSMTKVKAVRFAVSKNGAF